MTRYLILFCASLLLSSTAHAAGTAKKPDRKNLTVAAVSALTDNCLPALEQRKDPASYVLAKGFAELPEEQARKFSPEGGRVFEIPNAGGNAVLMTNRKFGDMCAVAVHQMTPKLFWETLDSKLKDFSLMREKRVEEDKITKKEYERDTIAGTLTVLVTGSDKPRPNGMQALMTLARVKK